MTASAKINPILDSTASAIHTVEAEIAGLRALTRALSGPLEAPLAAAIDAIQSVKGRVVVTGMGKSGHVARKIAATLSSTGTPAFYLHPGEASHGDLGMIAQGDVVLALSWSGKTPELGNVINYCKRFAAPLIAICSAPESALAKAADVPLVLPAAPEACPNGLAPTTSTTMMLAFGDALAIALLESRGFSAADFRSIHPGGRLGMQLITVADLMAKGEALPRVLETATISDAIFEITRARYGGAAVVDAQHRLVGVFTDGDLRRALPKAALSAPVADHMSHSPIYVEPQLLATEALRVMNNPNRPITLIFACEGDRLVGAVHMHDLLRAGIA
jgi:arabinose-5-phosphate isomerase